MITLNEEKICELAGAATHSEISDPEVVHCNLSAGRNRILVFTRQSPGKWSYAIQIRHSPRPNATHRQPLRPARSNDAQTKMKTCSHVGWVKPTARRDSRANRRNRRRAGPSHQILNAAETHITARSTECGSGGNSLLRRQRLFIAVSHFSKLMHAIKHACINFAA